MDDQSVDTSDIDEFFGYEFDCYAIDSQNAIALFATSGAGDIPPSVMQLSAEDDEISESIDSPNWESSLVWNAYASQGLYIYG